MKLTQLLAENTGRSIHYVLEDMKECLKYLKVEFGKLKQADASHSIGGPYRAVSSGKVEIREPYNEPQSYAGMSIRWDSALVIGTNVNGDALELTKKGVEALLEVVRGYSTTEINQTDAYNALVTVTEDDGTVGQIHIRGKYASSFCTVCFRRTK